MFAKVLFIIIVIKYATGDGIGRRDFKAELLYYTSIDQNFNFLISPYGVSAVVNKISYSSFDTSRKQLQDAFLLSDEDKYIVKKDRDERYIVQDSRNSGLQVTVNDYMYIYKELMTKEYLRELENFAITIEETVDEIYNSMLNYVIPIGNSVTTTVTAELDGDAKIGIINVLSMVGKYGLPFNKSDTKIELFYKDDVQSYSVNMMSVEGRFKTKTIKYLNAEAIALPYGKDEKYIFYILKPNKGVTISDVLKKLKDYKIPLVADELKLTSVKMPRFNVNKHTGVIDALKRMNVTDIFEETPNNFAKFTNARLQVTKFYQKVDVKIAEPTYIPSFEKSSDIPEYEFHCNKPFIYYLIKTSSDDILFSGIYSKPSI